MTDLSKQSVSEISVGESGVTRLGQSVLINSGLKNKYKFSYNKVFRHCIIRLIVFKQLG